MRRLEGTQICVFIWCLSAYHGCEQTQYLGWNQLCRQHSEAARAGVVLGVDGNDQERISKKRYNGVFNTR